ncbi:MAG: hypothetical protein ACE5D0_10285 [Fidelibacterota bacterium]
MNEDKKILPVSNYVKEYDLRITCLPARPILFISIEAGGRFIFSKPSKLFFYQTCTIAKLVN